MIRLRATPSINPKQFINLIANTFLGENQYQEITSYQKTDI